MNDHFITEQSAERVQTKDAQPHLVTLSADAWREVGGANKQKINRRKKDGDVEVTAFCLSHGGPGHVQWSLPRNQDH